MANYQNAAVQVPDTVSEPFQATESQKDDCFNQTTHDEEPGPQPPQATRLQRHSLDQQSEAQQARTGPTTETMARVIRELHEPPRQEIMSNPSQSSRSISETTLMAPAEMQEDTTSQKNETTAALTELNKNQEAMFKILQVPALLKILQFIAALMDIVGRSREGKVVTPSQMPVTPS